MRQLGPVNRLHATTRADYPHINHVRPMKKQIIAFIITAIAFSSIGYLYSRHASASSDRRLTLSNAELEIFPKPLMRPDKFLSYGKIKVNGIVIKTMKQDAPWDDLSSCIIVPYDERHNPGSYEILYDHGVYLIHIRGEIIRFSCVTVKNSSFSQDIKMGNTVLIDGEYGEYSNSSGSTTSLSNLGLFIVNPVDIKITRGLTSR